MAQNVDGNGLDQSQDADATDVDLDTSQDEDRDDDAGDDDQDAAGDTDEVTAESLAAEYADDPKGLAQLLLDATAKNEEEAGRNDALENRVNQLEQQRTTGKSQDDEDTDGAAQPPIENYKDVAMAAIQEFNKSEFSEQNPGVAQALFDWVGKSVEYITEKRVREAVGQIESRMRDSFLDSEDPALVREFQQAMKRGDTRTMFKMFKQAKVAADAPNGGPRPLNRNKIDLASARRAPRKRGSISGLAGRSGKGKPKVSEQLQTAAGFGLVDLAK